MNKSWTVPCIVIGIVFSILCCICILLYAAAFMIWNVETDTPSQLGSNAVPTDTPVVVRPPLQAPLLQPTNPSDLGGITPTFVPTIGPGVFTGTLELLKSTSIQINDPFDLARRLRGITGISPTLEPRSQPYRIGEQETFWVADTDADENFQVQATLGHVTEHAYFWIEDGLSFDNDALVELAETFEDQIYPTTRTFFGSEWSPGIDGDPHLYILYVEGIGRTVAGMFSSRDAYPPQIQDFSNGHEMFLLHAENLSLDEEYTYGVLAHEFQHMIHWYRDPNETTWMNEGFSDLAMFLNGYNIGGHDYIYARNPDLQLNDWPSDPNQTFPHYGAAFLFMNYFLDRFDEDVTKALVSHPANGLDSIDQILDEISATDPLKGNKLTADDLFIDWVLTSILQDGSIGDGRYQYRLYPGAPQPSETETVRLCGDGQFTRDVRQYGVDYIRILCREDTTLHFEGSIQVDVVPGDPHSGFYYFWSNRSDESDMTLTRSFDFTGHEGPLTLSYWTWYDIEENYDYLYLQASSDGENWQILNTPSGTSENPTGANYGWGYTGLSGGDPRWIKEEVDLSQFAGQRVSLRFEYLTDTAVHGEGFLLDDIAIPEIGYTSDFELDEGGWQSNGFVRIQNILPQTFRLALITRTHGSTSVEYIPLSADNVADIRLQFSDDVNEAILVVAGTTRHTRQPAPYRFNFIP